MYHLLFAGDDGQLYDHRTLRATGRAGDRFVELMDDDMEKLPSGASLALVPGGTPVGLTRTGQFTTLEQNPWADGRSWAVGALLPQGYTRTLMPSYVRDKKTQPLPLLGYTAVACRNGELYVAALRTDEPHRWDPAHYDTTDLPALVRDKLASLPENRILSHLAHCALEYHCFTAQNIFYGRWEGGIPVSPACNARCLGCISLQPAGCCPSPQARIKFRPSPAELAEVAVPHLNGGDGAIVSFGQGCEGEPALAAGTIAETIERVRGLTGKGTINMNSNGGCTAGVKDICRAGLNAIRVSLISALGDTYDAYYRPQDYSLADVRRSLEVAVSHGVYTSLNLLVLPGLTDRADEVKALAAFVRETGVNLVQLRNLNIDPDWLFERLPGSGGDIIGVAGLIEALKEVPGLSVGNYSRPVR
ncbi:radical SAM protein [Pelotomaculum isophthalicicum JI]|uniref:Radical SAM protein n=1 Tax=Pelotomaculum isophthalicicum JI TaxID=947010 RepID=A0A9X4JV40_9FIRM|nr:radical SAM protein [Pelotomaculum isophthalicicum]MDF9407616.1 radical SAM protein [Pelotomaculum isophthalicicum JI]